MDIGFTEHSGCPVIQGEKWITTVWMREGVDAEHTWAMYDPSGEPEPLVARKAYEEIEMEVSAF